MLRNYVVILITCKRDCNLDYVQCFKPDSQSAGKQEGPSEAITFSC